MGKKVYLPKLIVQLKTAKAEERFLKFGDLVWLFDEPVRQDEKKDGAGH